MARNRAAGGYALWCARRHTRQARRARGTGIGMMRHGAAREGSSPSGGAVNGARERILGRAWRA